MPKYFSFVWNKKEKKTFNILCVFLQKKNFDQKWNVRTKHGCLMYL